MTHNPKNKEHTPECHKQYTICSLDDCTCPVTKPDLCVQCGKPLNLHDDGCAAAEKEEKNEGMFEENDFGWKRNLNELLWENIDEHGKKSLPMNPHLQRDLEKFISTEIEKAREEGLKMETKAYEQGFKDGGSSREMAEENAADRMNQAKRVVLEEMRKDITKLGKEKQEILKDAGHIGIPVLAEIDEILSLLTSKLEELKQ